MSSDEPLLIDEEDGNRNRKVVSVDDYGKALGQAKQMGETLRREKVSFPESFGATLSNSLKKHRTPNETLSMSLT